MEIGVTRRKENEEQLKKALTEVVEEFLVTEAEVLAREG